VITKITVLRYITPSFVETDVSEEASARFLRMRVVTCVHCTDINESLMGWLCLSHHVLQLTKNG